MIQIFSHFVIFCLHLRNTSVILIDHTNHKYYSSDMTIPKKTRSQGFTLVELAIVISVIAILTILVLVAYNGIQQRAYNSKTLELVSYWEKNIRLLQAKNITLPNDWTCLGNSVNDFAAIPSDQIGLGQCERNIIVQNASPDWTSEFKTVPTPGQTKSTPELLAQNTTQPTGLLPMQKSGINGYIRGIVYASIFEPARAPNGKPGAYIFYALANQACPPDRAYRIVSSLNVCAAKLTTDNYANEVYQPDPSSDSNQQ